MRPRVQPSGEPRRDHDRHRGERQDDQERHQDGDHDELHLAGPDLLPEVLGGSADHQPADEHGDDDVEEHAVQAAADAAPDHLADRDVEHRREPAERPGRSRASSSRCRSRRRWWRPPTATTRRARYRTSLPSRFGADAEIAGRLHGRGGGALARDGDDEPGDHQDPHRGEDRPALPDAARPSCRTCR